MILNCCVPVGIFKVVMYIRKKENRAKAGTYMQAEVKEVFYSEMAALPNY